jgi:putative transposase
MATNDFLIISKIEQKRKYHHQILKEIKKLNRNLSKKRKGSNQRKKAKRRLAKLHIKVSNQRKDFGEGKYLI